MIKKINLILCFISIVINAHTQNNVDKVLRKYRNDEGVASFNFAGNLTRFLGEDKTLKTRIETCDVLVFNSPQNISVSDLNKIKAAIVTDRYDELMNIKDKKGKLTVHAISTGDILSKVFAQVSAEGKNIYFTLTGKIFFEELGKLNLDFSGGEQFKGLFKQ
jgi:hypothetical protein